MCRSIKPLFNFDPPATEEEIHSAALQFVRKISGFTEPSHKNKVAFTAAVEAIAGESRVLMKALTTTAPHKNRQAEAAKKRARWAA